MESEIEQFMNSFTRHCLPDLHSVDRLGFFNTVENRYMALKVIKL